MTLTDVKRPAAPQLTETDSFPITWQHSDDARLFWTQERQHSPRPIAPLAFSLQAQTFEPGFRAATEAYALPIAGPRYWRLNTYLYSTMMFVGAAPKEMAARGRRAQAKLSAAMGHLADRWEHEWLPEIKAHRSFVEGVDLRGASLAALAAYLNESLARSTRLWDLHFQVLFPAFLAVSLFEDSYRDLFPGETPFDAYRLLSGFDNKSMERDRVLWRLSREALAAPEVRAALGAGEPADTLAALQQTSEGRLFAASLEAFLAEFGYGGDPAWIRAPRPILQIIQQYMAQPERDPMAELAGLAAEREQRVAEVRARLTGYPAPVREQFEFLLGAAQVGNVLMEDHAHWIDHRATSQVLWELGRRLAAVCVLDTADDLELLTVDEVHETATAIAPTGRQALVAARRAEMEHFAAITPPASLGVPPAGAPPDNPLMAALGKFFGAAPPPAQAIGEVRGSAGSPGRVRGKARVIRSLDDAHRLRAGDILVAESTGPSWTPLFVTAAAVVTDTGGILSHSASLAREYRLPAVVGTAVATRQIPDGALVEVDGDNGVIRLVE